jgi:hypothetical protein
MLQNPGSRRYCSARTWSRQSHDDQSTMARYGHATIVTALVRAGRRLWLESAHGDREKVQILLRYHIHLLTTKDLT